MVVRAFALMSLSIGCAVDGPSIRSVAPDLVCDDASDGVVVRIEGADFTSLVTGALGDTPELQPPTVRFTPRSGLAEGAPPVTTDTLEAAPRRVTPIGTTALEIAVDQGLGLVSGSYDVTVRNPDRREDTLLDGLVVVGAPSPSGLYPNGVCQQEERVSLVINGSDFVTYEGLAPTLQLGDDEVTASGFEGCVPLAGGRSGEVCTGIRFEVEPQTMAFGSVPVIVTNPDPVSCVATPVELEVLRPSTLNSVQPEAICYRDEPTILRGTDLLEGTEVFIAGVKADVTWVSRTELHVTPGPNTPFGVHDLDIRPSQGCAFTVPSALTVRAAPLVFDVDPPALPAGVSVEVTARASDILHPVDDAWLELVDSGERIEVDWSWEPSRPGEIRLVAPGDLVPGVYEVFIGQESSCPGEPSATLSVLDASNIPLDRIEPAFAWTYAASPGLVYAQDPLPRGAVGLDVEPRMWLIGPDGAPGSTALLGVDARGTGSANAVIPDGLVPGEYALLAVSDDGAVGLLPEALTVVDDVPPEIEGVAPATLANRAGVPIRITGRGFVDPTLSLTCRDRSGTETTVAGAVLSFSWSGIEATIPADQLAPSVCVVTVENSDGTRARWSAVSVTNPAQNLFPWQAGPEMVEARRAVSFGAGRTTSVSRWVYAIGGDDGTDAGAKRSLEVAPIGIYGDIGGWSLSPRELPAARTRAGLVRLGQFLYLVAGSDGTNAVSTVYRAIILDPVRVPRFESLEVTSLARGLEEGRWSYQVSAVFPATDPTNPGGESLPSEVIVANLPDGVAPTLRWQAVAGASGYRVYRVPSADGSRAEMGLLAEVSKPLFTDDGSIMTVKTGPLRQGALGSWVPVSSLNTPRSSPCVVAVKDPDPDPDRWWIFAAGGLAADGTPLDTIERVEVENYGRQRQIVGAWTTMAERLAEPRSECGAYGVEADLHGVVEPGETFVYFAGGIDRRGKTTGTVDAGEVLAGGVFSGWSEYTDIRPPRAGFGVLSASNFLYGFGGAQGRPSATGTSADLTSSFPDVQNWNSLGTALTDDRYLPGSAKESAVIIVGGGETSGSAASRSVDWTNW